MLRIAILVIAYFIIGKILWWHEVNAYASMQGAIINLGESIDPELDEKLTRAVRLPWWKIKLPGRILKYGILVCWPVTIPIIMMHINCGNRLIKDNT